MLHRVSSLRLSLLFGMTFVVFSSALWTTPELHVIADRQAENTLIAYVSSSIDNQEIRLISPDGTNDRPLWQIPTASHPLDSLGTLSWRPDGRELLFDSGHDWQRSMGIRDLYAISANGSALRRVTRPPDPTEYEHYPTGTVTFIINAAEQGDVQVYIEGASEPLSYFARTGVTYQITQTIADLGEGIRQSIRLWDPDQFGYPCHYSEEGWVDVVPGQLTDFGSIQFNAGTSDVPCPRMFSGSWSFDGSQILYLYREPAFPANPMNNIWQMGDTPPIGTNGERILNMNNYVNRGKLYRVVFAPTAAKQHEFLFLQGEGTQDLLFHATLENPANHSRIDLGLCQYVTCDILDVAWLPDGSGFYVTQLESGVVSDELPPVGGVLYHYHVADSTLTEILRLPNEVIGKLSVSPDGTAIVFERADALEDTVDRVNWGQLPNALANYGLSTMMAVVSTNLWPMDVRLLGVLLRSIQPHPPQKLGHDYGYLILALERLWDIRNIFPFRYYVPSPLHARQWVVLRVCV